MNGKTLRFQVKYFDVNSYIPTERDALYPVWRVLTWTEGKL